VNLMDWTRFHSRCEFHVNETVRDVQILHDESMFAVAQKKYVYIYDKKGVELHCLRNHIDVNRMEFLPYHFLLATVGSTGYLKYQDTSTGANVAEHRTKMGECDVMCQNPQNAIIHLGHSNGQVTLWSPNMSTSLVKIFTHNAALRSIAVDGTGHYMVTAALDGQVRVWDLRAYRQLHSYFSIRPASAMDISQTGLLAVGCGPHVQVWKDALALKAQSPYLVQDFPGKTVQAIEFCPFEDILGVSHSQGYSSLVVPGAGTANFDSFEANPFQTKKQRRENTVVSLLEKLQSDMITLDVSAINVLDSASPAVREAEKKEAVEATAAEAEPEADKKKMRGKSKSARRWRRKRNNIVDKKVAAHREEVARKLAERQRTTTQAQRVTSGATVSALSRFERKVSS